MKIQTIIGIDNIDTTSLLMKNNKLINAFVLFFKSLKHFSISILKEKLYDVFVKTYKTIEVFGKIIRIKCSINRHRLVKCTVYLVKCCLTHRKSNYSLTTNKI